MSRTDHIAIALSGGGHRATAFGLGALQAVADAGLHGRTSSISSVSGGSIANGIVMTGPDFSTATAAALEAHFSPALKAVSERGVLLKGAPATKGFIRALAGSAILGLAALIVGIVTLALHRWVVMAVAAVVCVIALGIAWRLFGQRSERTEAAVDGELLGGHRLTLADVQRRGSAVHHVICTTELQTGEPFYFTNRAVYGYRFGGSTEPSTVPLGTAVQASACVPGAFNPRIVDLTTLGVQPPKNREGVRTASITSIVLCDGGVYDNMADQWEYGFEGRAKQWPALAEAQPHRATFLIVVNGSGGWNDPKPIGRTRIAHEIAGLMRSQAVQYDVSTADRRQALYAEFRRPESPDEGTLGGIFAQITDSPYRIARMFCSAATGRHDSLADRADAAIAFLDAQGYTEAGWTAIVKRTSSVATTLAPLGLDLTSELVEHGYVLTMLNLHVLEDACPLRPIDRDRFRRMCS